VLHAHLEHVLRLFLQLQEPILRLVLISQHEVLTGGRTLAVPVEQIVDLGVDFLLVVCEVEVGLLVVDGEVVLVGVFGEEHGELPVGVLLEAVVSHNQVQEGHVEPLHVLGQVQQPVDVVVGVSMHHTQDVGVCVVVGVGGEFEEFPVPHGELLG